jgi:hypothetical protein
VLSVCNQSSPRYLAPGGLTLKIFKNSGEGEDKLIGFNGQLWRSPQNFFFNKNHNFLKIFAKILLKSQSGGPKEIFLRNICKFSPKNILWSPFEVFS